MIPAEGPQILLVNHSPANECEKKRQIALKKEFIEESFYQCFFIANGLFEVPFKKGSETWRKKTKAYKSPSFSENAASRCYTVPISRL